MLIVTGRWVICEHGLYVLYNLYRLCVCISQNIRVGLRMSHVNMPYHPYELT